MSIIMYTKTGCPWCNEARELLQKHNIAFEEREVREHPENMEELQRKSGQDKTPTFDIDGEIYADSSAEEITPVLKDKGVFER